MSLKELVPSYHLRIKRTIELAGTGKRVLDVGCGDGFLELYLKKNFKEVYGIDINEFDLTIARNINPEKRVHFIKAPATKLPFKNNFFDAVVCTEVIEHIKDDKKVASEIRRVLKKNGTLIITTPDRDFPFLYDPINYLLMRLFKVHLPIGVWGFGHVKLYSKKDMVNLLKGFKVKKIMNDPHILTAFIENFYFINLLQPFLKSDPKNKERTLKDIKTLKKRILSKPSKFLVQIRDMVIKVDNYFYKDKDIGIILIAKAEKK